MDVYLGIDVGSVTTKLVALDSAYQVLVSLYRRTHGRPIEAVQQGLIELHARLAPECRVAGVGTTGSGRQLAGVVIGADIVKNEITAHAVGASHFVPDVQTIIEIGGQDSKIILLRHSVVVDFAMNTVCAAGTGAFLDQQAFRLGIAIEEFGPLALRSTTPVHIAGRCTVFAESDMIHKQQMGHRREDILYGLCQALARNYLNNLGLGKDIQPPVVFLGGVAFNQGIVRAFEEILNLPIIVPPHHEVMGAIGAAMLAHEAMRRDGNHSRFRGFQISQIPYRTSSFECQACPNLCEIVQVRMADKLIDRWGGRCDRWEFRESEEEKQAHSEGRSLL